MFQANEERTDTLAAGAVTAGQSGAADGISPIKPVTDFKGNLTPAGGAAGSGFVVSFFIIKPSIHRAGISIEPIRDRYIICGISIYRNQQVICIIISKGRRKIYIHFAF